MLTYYTASNVIQNKSNTDKISALIWLQKQGYIKQFNKNSPEFFINLKKFKAWLSVMLNPLVNVKIMYKLQK